MEWVNEWMNEWMNEMNDKYLLSFYLSIYLSFCPLILDINIALVLWSCHHLWITICVIYAIPFNNSNNCHSSTLYIYLHLNPVTTCSKSVLFKTIASLSYLGDPRMYFAENPQKVGYQIKSYHASAVVFGCSICNLNV